MQKKPLSTMKKHLGVRKRADEVYKRNANRMKLKHAKRNKVREFTVGQSVSVRVPRIDRASTDPQRLPCVVVEVVGKAQAMYRLRSKFGVLKVCYHAGDLEGYSCKYDISVDGWEEAERITLREAAKLSSPWNVFTGNKCNCSSGCDSRKCPCKKKAIDCSSFCHNGKTARTRSMIPKLLDQNFSDLSSHIYTLHLHDCNSSKMQLLRHLQHKKVSV